MAYPIWRWVICPLVQYEPRKTRPLVAFLDNPDDPDRVVFDELAGREITVHYGFGHWAQVHNFAKSWCLLHVLTESPEGDAVLDAHPDIEVLAEFDHDLNDTAIALERTPRLLGLTERETEDLKTRIDGRIKDSVETRGMAATARDPTVDSLTRDSTVREFLSAIAEKLEPDRKLEELTVGWRPFEQRKRPGRLA